MKTIREFLAFLFMFPATILVHISQLIFPSRSIREFQDFTINISMMVHTFFCPFIHNKYDDEKEEE